jgi:CheY-like chemotaxis protein
MNYLSIMDSETPLHKYILYAEDDPDDRELLDHLVKKIDPAIQVITFPQGLALYQFLEALLPGEYLPSVMILDMNMPIWDGMHTLIQLKKNTAYKDIPIVMFSTSSADKEASQCAELGAAAFITKPIHHVEMMEVTKKFAMYSNSDSIRK